MTAAVAREVANLLVGFNMNEWNFRWNHTTLIKAVVLTIFGICVTAQDKQIVKQALEYVSRVENSQCTGGTEEVLQLDFNNTVWASHTEPAIRTANFLTDILLADNNSLLSISDEMLFSMVRNNIHGSDVIFGSAIAIEPGIYTYSSYCPYAYKKNDTVFAHDIAVNYNYLDVSTEWYHAIKVKNWDNITIKHDEVKYRSGSSLLPVIKIDKILASLDDGHWTKPYYDCGGGDIWMVTYSSPIFGLNDSKVVFQGVATIDIELTNIDINQCDSDKTSSGALDIFRGTHSCQPTTKCQFTPGLGFRRGAYRCICLDGYYFPHTNAQEKYFRGEQIETYYSQNASLDNMKCLPCAVGCDTCVDYSPCLYERSLSLTIVLMLLTVLTIIGICLIWIITFLKRNEMAIKSGSPIFLQLMCLGSLLMCSQLFLEVPESNHVLCAIIPWPFYLGFNLMYGALILKTWRISVIFKAGKLKRVHLPDRVLLQRLIPIVAVTLVYLVAWTVSAQVKSEVNVTPSKLKFTVCTLDWWSYAILGAELLMLLFGVYLCFTVRKAPAHFNESKHITWSTYNAIILGTFLILISHFITDNPDILYVISFLRVQVFVTITLSLIFIPKIFALYKHTDVPSIVEPAPSVTRTVTGREKQDPLQILAKHSKKVNKTVATQTSQSPFDLSGLSTIIHNGPKPVLPNVIKNNKIYPSPSPATT